MFKVKIDSGILKPALQALGVMVDECILHTDKDGFRVIIVDPANVGLVKLHIPTSSFEEYNTSEESEIGFDVAMLDDIRFDENLISLETYPDEGRPDDTMLNIQFGDFEYELRTPNLGGIRKEPTYPKMDLSCSASIKAIHLREAIFAAGKISDYVRIAIRKGDSEEEDCLELSTKHEETRKVNVLETEQVKYTKTRKQLGKLTANKNVRSLLSLDYLTDISKAIPPEASVNIELGNDYPIILTYNLPSTQTKITFMCAPRVEKD